MLREHSGEHSPDVWTLDWWLAETKKNGFQHKAKNPVAPARDSLDTRLDCPVEGKTSPGPGLAS